MSGREHAVPGRVWIGVLALAAATLVAELFVHHHASFGIDGGYAFYAWYTLAVAVGGVLLARLADLVLRRPGPTGEGPE